MKPSKPNTAKRNRNERKEESRVYKEVSKEEWFKSAKEKDDAEEESDEELLEDSDDSGSDDGGELPEKPDLETVRKWVQRYDPAEEEESEDETHNTIGKVPLQWYSEYPHIGYNLEGEKILKKDRKDQIQEFIDRDDDPNYWRTVYDEYNDREVVLTKEDIKMLQKMKQNKFPHKEFDPYPELFEADRPPEIHPVTNKQAPKSRFLPSKWEAKRVAYLVKAIKRGWIQLKHERKEKKPDFYGIWETEEDIQRNPNQLPAPRTILPGHAASYNPPAEYLWDKEELAKWKELDPEDRASSFVPQKHKSLREVPIYSNFIRERFERCLDLYLVPRKADTRQKLDPQKLLPTLPKRDDLRPFPTTKGMEYIGHTDRIRSVSVDPTGQFIVSGSDDNTVRIWEISTGRCYNKWDVGSIVHSVAWNPNPAVNVIAVAVEDDLVLFINPETGSAEGNEITANLLSLKPFRQPALGKDRKPLPVLWRDPKDNQTPAGGTEGDEAEEENSAEKKDEEDEDEEKDSEDEDEDSEEETGQAKRAAASSPYRKLSGLDSRITLVLVFSKTVKKLTWHHKGDYLATVAPDSGASAVLLHQISQQRTQNPFRKSKGQLQDVLFHPTKPIFFVATQRYIRVYDLLKQQLIKKLFPGVKWISSLAAHKGGDNILMGSYDCRVCWFDLDYSTKPYKMLRHHKMAIRQVAYHPGTYPLFATCSDDGTIYVFHGMVYDDLMQNPLIVPLKRLKAHPDVDGFGVLDCVWHPIQPWIISSGADAVIRLWTT